MGFIEQRNPYKGIPPRPWVSLQMFDSQGVTKEFDGIADTGNPFAIIINLNTMAQFKLWDGPSVNTNFGVLSAGRVRVVISELKFAQEFLG